MPRLTRRSLLIGVSLAAVGSAAFWALSPRRFIEAVIRHHFRPGEVAEAEITRFADDYFARRAHLGDIEHRVFGRLGGLGLMSAFDGVHQIEDLRKDALLTFILGSTAMGRVDENEPIAYVSFPDPYEVGCVVTWS